MILKALLPWKSMQMLRWWNVAVPQISFWGSHHLWSQWSPSILPSDAMPKLASRVYLEQLHLNEQLEQQCSQPQGDFVGQLLNLEVRGNLWWANSFDDVG
jgi:hypothetical protein